MPHEGKGNWAMLLLRLLGVGTIVSAVLLSSCSRTDVADKETPAPSPALQATGATWLTDYPQARNTARANQKLLLVDFTGSDWCGWCIRLKREVFTQPEFIQYAKDNLVLLEIDFPRGKPQSDEQKRHNEKLLREFGVDQFPTILIMQPDGTPIGVLSYMPGGPPAFIAELDKLKRAAPVPAAKAASSG
jgi:protein disulfide-isomerase